MAGAQQVTVSGAAAAGLTLALVPNVPNVVAGQGLSLLAAVVDSYGNAVPYQGTVQFSSSDQAATLPGPVAWSSTAAGAAIASVSVTFVSQGNQWVTAYADTLESSTARVTVLGVGQSQAPSASRLALSTASPAVAGIAQDVVVTVLNGAGQVFGGYERHGAFQCIRRQQRFTG